MTSQSPLTIQTEQYPINPVEYAKVMLNILEDFAGEKERLEDTQRAMLNLLEDFDVERSKTEAANLDLRESVEALRIAKEATEAMNRELEAFSYSVSHDLRSPLRGVAGFSQLLLEDYYDRLDEEGKDYLKRMVDAAEQMGFLIDDLLKLSQVSRAVMEHEQVNLSVIARNIVERLSESYPGRSVEFILNEGLPVFGDKNLLTVAIENLLGNAWKFTEKSEKAVIEFGTTQMRNAECGVRNGKNSQSEIKEEFGVHSEIRTPHSEIVYYVRDNGAGFDMTYVDKLFKPFQRLHKVKEFPGTGIGLATVKRIIERHGGRIWIKGEPGKGTTVYFTL